MELSIYQCDRCGADCSACAAIIEKAQRIYSEGEENRNEGGAK